MFFTKAKRIKELENLLSEAHKEIEILHKELYHSNLEKALEKNAKSLEIIPIEVEKTFAVWESKDDVRKEIASLMANELIDFINIQTCDNTLDKDYHRRVRGHLKIVGK